jgi:hypothetical protein
VLTSSGDVTEPYCQDQLHKLSTRFVLAINGCDGAVVERLIAGESFEPSDNNYDYLGHGIYFRESDPLRDMASRLSSTANGSGLNDVRLSVPRLTD